MKLVSAPTPVDSNKLVTNIFDLILFDDSLILLDFIPTFVLIHSQ